MKFFYFYLISYSIIGYGFLLTKFLKIRFFDFGSLGILGITVVSIISFISSIFFKHGFYFNSIILLLGLSFFVFNLIKSNQIKQEILNHFIIFFILCIFIVLAKNHDDFPYYHFPYISIITEFSHPIGLGQLNNGFRSPSSIFFVSSLFYLPYVDIYLFHITPALILGFVNLILIKNIFDKDIFNEKKIVNFLSLATLIFINIIFYRLAEHGTDRSGMILIILAMIFFVSLVNDYQNSKSLDEMKFLIICICFVSTLKPFYLLNFIFFSIFLINPILRKNFFDLFFTRTFYFCLLLIFSIIFYTFINSACLIFPINNTCFENLPWSLNKDYIQEVKIWFELWSKAGANPNYVVEDSIRYISGLNWIPNWINEYFFNKVLDYLLGIILLSLIFILSFFKKKKKVSLPKKNGFWALFFIIIILLIEWFYNHPALRYGGYHLIFLAILMPICMFLSRINFDYNFFLKRATTLILVTIGIFIFRNYQRLEVEFERYNFNPMRNSNDKITEKEEVYYSQNIPIKDHLSDYSE